MNRRGSRAPGLLPSTQLLLARSMDKDRNWLRLDVAPGHTLFVPQPGQSPGDAACQAPPAQQPPSAGPHAGPLRGEGLCHLRGLPALPPSPGLPRFPDGRTTSPGPWPPGQLALPASHGREAECWATVSSLAGLRRIPGDPASAMNWPARLRPHSHRPVGPAWSARGQLQGRTLSRELLTCAFSPTKRRRQVVLPGGGGSWVFTSHHSRHKWSKRLASP